MPSYASGAEFGFAALLFVGALFIVALVRWSVMGRLESQATMLLVLVTAVLAAGTLWLAGISTGQLAEMQAEQRPWIKVETEKVVGSLRLFSSRDDDPQAVLVPTFKLTNVGKSPAFNVQFFLWGFGPSKSRDDALREYKERCERERSRPLDNPARGATVFPGDHTSDADMLDLKYFG